MLAEQVQCEFESNWSAGWRDEVDRNVAVLIGRSKVAPRAGPLLAAEQWQRARESRVKSRTGESQSEARLI